MSSRQHARDRARATWIEGLPQPSPNDDGAPRRAPAAHGQQSASILPKHHRADCAKNPTKTTRSRFYGAHGRRKDEPSPRTRPPA